MAGMLVPMAAKRHLRRPARHDGTADTEVAGDIVCQPFDADEASAPGRGHIGGGPSPQGSGPPPNQCQGRYADASAGRGPPVAVAVERSRVSRCRRHCRHRRPWARRADPRWLTDPAPGRPPPRTRAGTRCTGRSSSSRRWRRPRGPARRGPGGTPGSARAPRDRALAAPARPPQRVQAAVVAGAGVGVRLDVAAVVEGLLGQRRPGQRGRRDRRRPRVLRRHTAASSGGRGRVDGEQRVSGMPSRSAVRGLVRVGARRSAGSRRPRRCAAAMAASAALPQARGSYSFLLPTSPSTLRTPS